MGHKWLRVFGAAVLLAAVMLLRAEASDTLGPTSSVLEHQSSLDASQGQYAVVSPIFADPAGNTSYLRLVNNGGADTGHGTFSSTVYTFLIVGSPSGSIYGNAAIAVPANAAPQYSIFDILSLAGISGLSGSDTAYTLYIQNPDEGTGFMHVVYNNASGFFENASICQSAPEGDAAVKYLFGADTSVLSAYPSQISIHNYASTAQTYQVTISDARSGSFIGTVNVPIVANATVSQPFSYFEQQLHWTPSANQELANLSFQAVGLSSTPAIVGNFIFNQKLNASVNMSTICSLAPASGIDGSNGGGSGGSGGSGGGSGSTGGGSGGGTGSSTNFILSLTVGHIGVGSGAVTAAPVALNCGAGVPCNTVNASGTASYAAGSTATLTAIPDAGSTFKGWSGACSGTGACTVKMNANQGVTATFEAVQSTPPATYLLNLSILHNGNGVGAVATSPSGINCGGPCTSNPVYLNPSLYPNGDSTDLSQIQPSNTGGTGAFVANRNVLLFANPELGSTFAGWGGACSGTKSPCVVVMTANQTVTATFGPAQKVTTYKLNLNIAHSGTALGEIYADAGIACQPTSSPTVCQVGPFVNGNLTGQGTYAAGTIVHLVASPERGTHFVGWSGACTGVGICVVVLNSDLIVTGTFAPGD